MDRVGNKYLALARVSSREQEREGFSLEVQEDALRRYATQHQGTITKLYRIAETASKKDERRAFKELLGYAKKHAPKLDGVLFFKVDRAARNLFDYVELERLETDHDLPVIYVSQPTENTPAGRMMRRTLANMAAFYTEQQSIDVQDGHERRVHNGLFVGKAPYGYRNVRIEGRSVVELDPKGADNVRRIFTLYAFHGHTLDSLVEQLDREGLTYTDSVRRFPRSKLYHLLTSRAYLGDVQYRGQWHPGKHEPLVDLATFQRVQTLLGGGIYRAHELTYASDLITCGHCGSPITGERKTKQTKSGERHYVYYRCTRYNTKSHPRNRVTEADLEAQIMARFDRIRIDDEEVRDWFGQVLRARVKDTHQTTQDQVAELNRQITLLTNQQHKLLNLRLLDEINADTFARKQTELRDQLETLKLQTEVANRSRTEKGEIAVQVFELSQTLRQRWLTADYRAKRQLLDIVGLNYVLNGVSLDMAIRKPFDVLVEGSLMEKDRGDRI